MFGRSDCPPGPEILRFVVLGLSRAPARLALPVVCGRTAPCIILKTWFFIAAVVLAGFVAVRPLSAVPSDPASLPSKPDPIEGIWTGTVTAPQGTAAEIGFEFFRAQDGAMIFKLNFPAMFTYAVTFGIPVEVGGGGSYAITPAFNTRLHLEGDELTGTFTLGRLPMRLHRGGVFSAPPSDSPDPLPPAAVWTRFLGSPTWAPPVVAGGFVYLGTADGKFHALRVADGAEAWTWTGASRIDGAAVVTDDTIFFIDGKVNLVALNRADGFPRWTVALHDEQLAGKPVPDNPTFNHRTAIPLVQDGVVYAGSSDGGLYAIAAASGAKLWRYDAGAPIFSGVSLRDKDTLMFGTMDGSVVLLDRRTRKELLRVRTGGGVVTAPLVVGDRLIVGSRDYMLYGFKLTDGTLAWKFSYWFSWIESTPVLRDGVVYVGASDYSRVTALDPATGETRWSTAVHGMNWGSPLVTGDRVFTGAVAQNLPGTAINHAGSLVALDRATGTVLWRRLSAVPAKGEFGGYAGSLALAGDLVIAAGFDGNLIALPAK